MSIAEHQSIDKVVQSVTNATKRLSQASTNTNSSKRKSQNHVGPWKLGRTLGRGSTGRVRLAKHSTTGQLAAVKIVPKSNFKKNDKQSNANKESNDGSSLPYGIEREIIIMKLISHPNVMGLYDVWENKNELYLVLEYIEGGELFDYLIKNGKLSEFEAINYFKQIINGIHYCHQFNICHRDLKPENLLLDKFKNIKIADFGMAALEMNEKLLETSCGSPHYASPEIVAGKTYHGAPSDIWSCGIILFALLTGHLPFDDENIRKLLIKVQNGSYSMPANLSRDAKDLISRMLRVNPEDRITIDKILTHPLLKNYPDPVSSTSPAPHSKELNISNLSDLNYKINSNKIDKEILKNLQILFHGANEKSIMRKLLSEETNSEKIFYYLLIKYRSDHSLTNQSSLNTIEITKKKSSIPRSVSIVKTATHDDSGKLVHTSQTVLKTPKIQRKTSERVLNNITNTSNNSSVIISNQQQKIKKSASRKKFKDNNGKLVITASNSFKKPVSFHSFGSYNKKISNQSIITNEERLPSVKDDCLQYTESGFDFNDIVTGIFGDEANGKENYKNNIMQDDNENVKDVLKSENLRIIKLKQELIKKQESEQKRQSLLLMEKQKEALEKLRQQEQERKISENIQISKLEIRKQRETPRHVSVNQERKSSLDPKIQTAARVISGSQENVLNKIGVLNNKKSFNQTKLRNLSSSSSRNLSSYLSITESLTINEYNKENTKLKPTKEVIEIDDEKENMNGDNVSELIPNPRFSRFSFNGLLDSKFNEEYDDKNSNKRVSKNNNSMDVNHLTMNSELSIGDIISTHTADVIKFQKPSHITRTDSNLRRSSNLNPNSNSETSTLNKDIFEDAVEGEYKEKNITSSNLNLKKLKKVPASNNTGNVNSKPTNIRMSLYAGNQVYDINREEYKPSENSPMRISNYNNELLKSAKQNSVDKSIVSMYQDVDVDTSLLSRQRTNLFDDELNIGANSTLPLDNVNESIDTFKHNPIVIDDSLFTNGSPFSNDEFLETSSLLTPERVDYVDMGDNKNNSDILDGKDFGKKNGTKMETKPELKASVQVKKSSNSIVKPPQNLTQIDNPSDARSKRSSIFSNHKPDLPEKTNSIFKNSSILRKFSLKPQREAPLVPSPLVKRPPAPKLVSKKEFSPMNSDNRYSKRSSNATTIETGFSYVPLHSSKDEIEEVDEFVDVKHLVGINNHDQPSRIQNNGKYHQTSSYEKEDDNGMKQSWFTKILNNFVSTSPAEKKAPIDKNNLVINTDLGSSDLIHVLKVALDLKQLEGTLSKVKIDLKSGNITANIPARFAHGRVLKFRLKIEDLGSKSSVTLIKEKGSSKAFKNLHNVVGYIIKNEEKIIRDRNSKYFFEGYKN